jgi:LPS sulfotransferase NodH
MSHQLAYLLCATPRSGTTLLCDLLGATGQAGRPRSYYRRQDILRHAAGWGLRPEGFADAGAFDRAYLAAVLEQGASGTGVFGMRMMWGTLAEFYDRLGPLHVHAEGRALLEEIFGPLVYVHVSRRDKVAQAISLLKAEQTGLWHMGADGSDRERTAPSAPVGYDADRIAETLGELEHDDAAWEGFFAQHGITPVRVEYETLAKSPQAELRKLLVALGRSEAAADEVMVRTSRMADAESRAWAARFRQERSV